MGVLPQALEIIFEVQRRRSNEKNKKRKNNLSNSQNTFFFPSLWTSYFQISLLFYFLFILNDLECYYTSAT